MLKLKEEALKENAERAAGDGQPAIGKRPKPGKPHLFHFAARRVG